MIKQLYLLILLTLGLIVSGGAVYAQGDLPSLNVSADEIASLLSEDDIQDVETIFATDDEIQERVLDQYKERQALDQRLKEIDRMIKEEYQNTASEQTRIKKLAALDVDKREISEQIRWRKIATEMARLDRERERRWQEFYREVQGRAENEKINLTPVKAITTDDGLTAFFNIIVWEMLSPEDKNKLNEQFGLAVKYQETL
jgi:DNA-binding helix-hairpin-helix protein with protein kinase domain